MIFTFIVSISSYSQSFDDLSNVNFSELNDSQIDLLLRRAGAQGFNQFDLLKMAKTQGFTQTDINNLDKRFKSALTIARIAESATAPLEETRLRKQWLDDVEVFREIDSDVFGFNVFRGTSFLSFQSNLNLPTPDDYIVGAGDKLFIDIYGQSESYYQVEISPEGYALLENIGPVNLNGLTIKDAKIRLINRFKKIYTGINNNKTFLNISIGIPRAIRINIAGEVQLPGTYNFSAFNTLYNALYVAGGITEKATLRDIRLYRNNKLISSVDVYKFLTKGDRSSNVRLENNDLILVGPYTNRITIEGAVKTPGKFEFKNNETLSDLIFYSGGFKENAYTKKIKVTRIIDDHLKVVDINSDQFDFFQLKTGDKFEIEEIIEKYNDRIIVKGAVYRPGIYSLTEEMTINDLINKAEGLKPDVFLKRATITRTNSDYSTTNISLNLKGELNNPQFNLQEEDIITIFSINDLSEESYVEISGEVSNSGIYPYSNNVSLIDLILTAGGLKDNATGKRVEITRRVSDENSDDEILSKVITVNISKDLENLSETDNFKLSPFDQVIVRKNPNFYIQQYANVEGEVMYPGKYAISSKSDRISDLLERAGGLKKFAYEKGATLIRLTEFAEPESDVQKKINNLNSLKDKILSKGDIIILFQGGHGFKILEETRIIEIKQGPYVEGKDKKIIER